MSLLCTLLEGNAERTARGLAASSFSTSGVSAAIDAVALCLALARGMGTELDGLVRKDDANEQELANDVAPRAARDEKAGALRASIVALRGRVSGAYGDVGLASLLLTEPCPREPVAAIAYARTAARALLDPTIVLPAAPSTLGTFDRPELARLLEADAAELDRARRAVQHQEALAKATLKEKQDALEHFDRQYRKSTDLAIALWNAAGLTEVVEKLWADGRERTTEEEEPEVPTEPAAPEPASAE